ncbi:MAG TPA: OpgC domain-containing protein [Candidatus Saccharimonadales bacterium]|nr:OpgC domain-containing protein [Candidatus Saccharimonadales bacterium]
MVNKVKTAVMVQAAKPERLIALDIIRGFFLLVIMIDHVEMYPSIFDLVTGRGRMYVSAAEGFFFMSGMLVGLVYRRRLARGMKFIFGKMWRRALELYIASIFFTLLYTWLALHFNHPDIKDGLYTVTNWPHIFKETVLMRYGYGWADFLDRFAILMFLAPFAFYLITKGRWWLLAIISAVAWAFRGNGFTLSWQIIFASAMIIGYYWYDIRARWDSLAAKAKLRLKQSVLALTIITGAMSWASVFILSLLNERLSSLPASLQSFTHGWNSFNAWIWLYDQKWTIGPIRIVLFLLWFSALFMLVNRYQKPISRVTKGVVETVGRNSLFVYVTHSIIVFGLRLLINTTGQALWVNFLVTAGGLAVLVAITLTYVRFMPPREERAKIMAQIKRGLLARPASAES